MELVSSQKLEAVADFLTNIEVDGNYLCGSFLEYLDGSFNTKKYVDDEAFCMEDCPMKSKENFIKWIKKPDSIYDIEDLEKPKQEDFIEWDRFGDGHVNDFRYAKALEQYCNDLENVLADTEYDLETAECENKELANKLEKIRGVLDGKD
jgi:hypothetical protein|nr:MAG TPA: hypothetical protein [Caudoviricetes sp.]